MAWPTARFWKLCALDLGVAAILSAVIYTRLPKEQSCSDSQAALAMPGFSSLSDSAPTPACLRFHIG